MWTFSLWRQDTVPLWRTLVTDWRSFGACRPSDSIGTKGLNRNIDESKFLQLVLCQWAWSSRETLHVPYFAPTRAMLLSFFFPPSSFLSLPRPYLFLPLRFAHAQDHSSISRSSRFLVNSRPRIISRIISVLVVIVVLSYNRHSRWNPPRPNDDVTLVHDSPCRTTSGFLFPFVQNEKRAKGRAEGGGRGGTLETGARATVLNGIIAIKVVAFPRGRRVRAPASYRRRTNDLN